MADLMGMYDGSGNGNYAFVKKERRGRRAQLPDDLAKKLKSCSVLGCEEWRDLSSVTTYHCFPTGDKNQQRWEIWTSLLQKARDDNSWIPFRGSLVCSHHFREVDFVHDPNQKRTKLIKNAIPSIFPSFTVDLDDPSFAIDETEIPENNVNENGNANESEQYEEDCYEYSNQNSYENEYDGEQGLEEEEPIMPVPTVHYDNVDEEEFEEEELQYQPASVTRSRPPNLIPARMGSIGGQTRTSQQVFGTEDEPPRKKSWYPVDLPAKPALIYKGNSKSELSSVGNSKSFSNKMSPNSTYSQSKSQPHRSKLYEQLCKASVGSDANGNGSSKHNFSWNPDLEIEVVETNVDESTWKQRVEELEAEKDGLVRMYESQIRSLQRKVKEQDLILNQFAAEMNSKRQRAMKS